MGYYRCDPHVGLKGVMKFRGNLSQNNLCPGKDSNLVPPEYELRELPLYNLQGEMIILKCIVTDRCYTTNGFLPMSYPR
jgi:hypothetical protein